MPLPVQDAAVPFALHQHWRRAPLHPRHCQRLHPQRDRQSHSHLNPPHAQQARQQTIPLLNQRRRNRHPLQLAARQQAHRRPWLPLQRQQRRAMASPTLPIAALSRAPTRCLLSCARPGAQRTVSRQPPRLRQCPPRTLPPPPRRRHSPPRWRLRMRQRTPQQRRCRSATV